MVVSINVFGSWLLDSAVSRLVSRLSISVKLSCGWTGVVEGVCAGFDVAPEYVNVEFFEGGVGGGVVGLGCTVCLAEFWVGGGDTCCFCATNWGQPRKFAVCGPPQLQHVGDSSRVLGQTSAV